MPAHGFRFSFTPLPGVLFTFPSRYLSPIGLPVVLSLGGWCRLFRTGLLRPRPTQGPGWVGRGAAYGAVTRYGPPFQARSATPASSVSPALQPRTRLDAPGLGWPPFARRYSGGHCCFPFLRLLGCFGSPGWPPHSADAAPSRGGLPHSDTRGSMAARASPRTFAACRVLPRLREPRHPPCAFSRLSPRNRTAAPRGRAALGLSLVSSRARAASPAPQGETLRDGAARLGASLRRACRSRGGALSLSRVVVSWRDARGLTAPARASSCLLSFHPVKEPPAHRAGTVENAGLEPATPGLQSRCSSRLSQSPLPPCSPGQTRTADPHIISVVL